MKRIIPALICAAIVFALPQTVQAHPGKTDSAGGHTDRSTGEYHYHHGYEAHQHYDMDGDGIDECPYDFDDQTGHDSGSSDNSSNNYVYDPPATRSTIPPIVMTTAYQETGNAAEEAKTVPHWVYWIFVIMSAVVFGLICAVRSKNTEIEAMQNRHYGELSEIIKKHDRELSEQERRLLADAEYQKKCFESQIEEKDRLRSDAEEEKEKVERKLHYVYENINTGDTYFPEEPFIPAHIRKIAIPDDVYFTKDHIPVKGVLTKNAPFGTYTVYVASKSTIFHENPSCANTSVKPVHIFEAAKNCRPCIRCGYGHTRSIPDWYTQLQREVGRANIRYVAEQTNFISLSGSEEDLEYYKDALKEDLTAANNKHILFDDEITIADMEEIAFEMNIPLSVAKRIVNLERSAVGSPMIK